MEAKKADNEDQPLLTVKAPWFLYTHEDSEQEQVHIYSVSSSPTDNKPNLKTIPQFCNKRVLTCTLGWFVLCDRVQINLFSLFNPITSRTVNLPPVMGAPEEEEFTACALTSPPDDDRADGYYVFVLCFYEVDELFFYRSNCNSWVKQELKFDDGRTAKVDQLLTVNGVVYGTTYKLDEARHVWTNELFYIEDDMSSLTLHSLSISLPDLRLKFLHDGGRVSLVESCGRIYYTYIILCPDADPYCIGAKAWVLDLQEKVWVEVKSLDGRAFFLNGCCTWCWGASPDDDDDEVEVESSGGIIQGNCFFFIDYHEENSETLLHSFNLVDQTWTILASCPSLISPYESLVWVMPQQNRDSLLAREESKESIRNKDVSNQGTYLSLCQELPSQHNESQESLFIDKLPFDIIKMISKCMHQFEYWNFRVSCKLLHSAIPAPPQWKASNTHPLFMFFKSQGELCILMDPCRLDSRSSTIIPTHVDPFSIVFAKNGWLVNIDDETSLQMFNLFTMDTIKEFPPLDESSNEGMKSYRGIAFSTCPTSPECLIVGIFSGTHSIMFRYLHPGEKKWSRITFEHEPDMIFCPTGRAPVFVRGAFYYLDQRGYLGVFRVVDGLLPSWQVYDRPNIELVNQDELLYLVECEGEVYLVFTEYTGKMRNQVFRLDDSNKNWVEVEHLGDHILFVSRTSCLSMVSNDPRMRNRIYLPMLKGNRVVFYSQDTNRYHTLGSDDDSMENWYGAMVPALSNCWI